MSSRQARVTGKGVFHALITVLTWILFFYWWKKVIPQISVEDATTSFLVIFLTMLGTCVLTLLWVRHNVGIFRRKGPRKGLPPVSEDLSADTLGRRLDHPGNEILKGSQVVVVSREGDSKHFSVPRSV